MKPLTVRLPKAPAARLEAGSRRRKQSRSDVVRERLTASGEVHRTAPLDAIADAAGSVDGLPLDLSARTKKYLKSTGYGGKRAR